MADARVAVCICTRDRPAELETALDSLRGSSVAIDQVLVSDDSTDERTATLVANSFPEAELIQGPRRGLAANRNAALARVRTSHLLFLDDDATLGSEFVAAALDRALRSARPERTIVTGRERQPEGFVEPRDLTFLGHQARPYRDGERLRTIVINATLFPTAVFRAIRFDPQLVYGSEEADFASRAVAEGFEIAFCPDAVNRHTPSDAGRSGLVRHREASRLYATWKRYRRTEGRSGKAALFTVIGGAHALVYGLRSEGLRGGRAAGASIATARRYAARLRREPGLDRC